MRLEVDEMKIYTNEIEICDKDDVKLKNIYYFDRYLYEVNNNKFLFPQGVKLYVNRNGKLVLNYADFITSFYAMKMYIDDKDIKQSNVLTDRFGKEMNKILSFKYDRKRGSVVDTLYYLSDKFSIVGHIANHIKVLYDTEKEKEKLVRMAEILSDDSPQFSR